MSSWGTLNQGTPEEEAGNDPFPQEEIGDTTRLIYHDQGLQEAKHSNDPWTWCIRY